MSSCDLGRYTIFPHWIFYILVLIRCRTPGAARWPLAARHGVHTCCLPTAMPRAATRRRTSAQRHRICFSTVDATSRCRRWSSGVRRPQPRLTTTPSQRRRPSRRSPQHHPASAPTTPSRWPLVVVFRAWLAPLPGEPSRRRRRPVAEPRPELAASSRRRHLSAAPPSRPPSSRRCVTNPEGFVLREEAAGEGNENPRKKKQSSE